ncbi:hypothetical protein BH24CHL1_BH24CHL1_05440 [soil metagenome]|jgi:hypothetical protein
MEIVPTAAAVFALVIAGLALIGLYVAYHHLHK